MTRKTSKNFTIAEFAIIMIVLGVLVGGVIRGTQLIRQSKMKRQANDLRDLVQTVEVFYERYGRLPGDPGGDGELDGNSDVWRDLEAESMASKDRKTPYGGEYRFGTGWFAYCQGNYVTVKVPGSVGEFVDRALDDGEPYRGIVRAESEYFGQKDVDVAHFIFPN
jgi:hypothetical protein